MFARGLLLICVLLGAINPLFASYGPTIKHSDPAICDSTDRGNYIWTRDPIPFGTETAVAELIVDDQVLINDVDVMLNIIHTWDDDVTATLISPDGTEILLFSHVGYGGDNFVDTYLNDDAETSIMVGQPPFTGSYIPMMALSTFNGLSGTGTWTLRIEDSFPAMDDGILIGWTLVLGGVARGNVYGSISSFETGLPLSNVEVHTLQGSHSTLSDSLGHYRLALPPGRFDIEIRNDGWCSQFMDSVQIVDLDSFEYNFSMRRPICVVSYSSLNYQLAASEVDTGYFTIQNNGNCGLTYRITSNRNWLQVDSDTGLIEADHADTIGVIYSALSLNPGEYSGALSITHNAAHSPQRLPVFLWVTPATSVSGSFAGLPEKTELTGNYPNPFNLETNIQYTLARKQQIKIELFNTNGQSVGNLLDQMGEPGYHLLHYDATALATGTYFIRMTTKDMVDTKKIILLK